MSEPRSTGSRRLLRALIALAGVALLAVGLLRTFVAEPGPAPLPTGSLDDVLALRDRKDLNVLFILVDTLRADRLGCYGYERDTSPNLDALAANGIRFAQQVSQSSWTKCSMASLWTGLYPARTRVTRSYDVVPEGARMPAEIFREAGFRTAGLWRNGWIAENFGFNQGFEVYLSPRSARRQQARVRRAANPNFALDGDDGDIINNALEFLRSHGHERWFLYLHMMDVHQYAYGEDSALFGSDYSDSYDNAIHWVDSLVGVLLDELDRRGLRERTFIVFSADHGEAFGEHDGEGHARNVYGEVTTTPLILAPPFRLEPGIVVEARSENVDLWPTVLDLLGLPPLPDTDGKSLVPEIVAAAQSQPEPDDNGVAFAQIDQHWARQREAPDPMVAVNQGRWRLIYRADSPERSELYDKWEDPLEQRNLAAEQPELTESLVAMASEYLKSRPPPWGGEEAQQIEIDEMMLNQLRALGYGVQ